MSITPTYHDPHKGERILDECFRCRLPIYASDPHRTIGIPPGTAPAIYHAGCAMAAEGAYWEAQLGAICNRLRGCGYTVDLRITRPVV